MTSGRTPNGEPDETRIGPASETETFGSGRYVVKEFIGEGTQKTVYLVHDTQLGRDCALSLLKTGLLQARELARLRREAQMMARLAHVNIVTVHAISDEAEERPYIVSEYVSAGDLREELREADGPLPQGRAIAIAKDVCRALGAAHRSGVIHRDLKPANIWLTEDGSAKLGDFGISWSIDRSRLTMPETMMGTAAYMAPEQAQAQEVTARTDLYSLGCVLYELLAGRPPFEGRSPLTVVSQHIHAQPTPPSEHGAELPQALERLVLRLLAKDPEDRPASALEVLTELEGIGSAETASPASGLGRFWARPAYRVLAAVLLFAAIGASVVGAIVFSGGGGGTTYREVRYHFRGEGDGPALTGDCQGEDLVHSFTATGPPAFGGSQAYTGDFAQEATEANQTVLFSTDGCRSGFVTLRSVLRDQEFNDLHINDAGRVSRTLSPGGESYTLAGTIVETVTGGTGIYKGATGGGTCSWVQVVSGPGNGTATTEGDCILQVTTDSAPSLRVPVVAGVVAGATEVTILGSPFDLPTTIEVLVWYWNSGTEPLTGLSLRLAPPDGADILTAAQDLEEQTATEGERVWALPDLPSGGFAQRFHFTLQFLASDGAAVPLVVEIDGDGFEEPVLMEPVVLTVVQ